MVVGYHLIWTAYGWWLPNDPRGSTSTHVKSLDLQGLGELHFGRKKLQPARRIVREFYDEARNHLRHELLTLSTTEVTAAAAAISEVIRKQSYTCYACAIMNDHLHILIRKHRQEAPEMIERLQDATCFAVRDCCERAPDHPVWTDGGWKGFLETREDFRRIIRYIEQNPVKIGRPMQKWDFVKPYDGWLPGMISRVKPNRHHQS
jgi:REP element-mobilizing transposase RayT